MQERRSLRLGGWEKRYRRDETKEHLSKGGEGGWNSEMRMGDVVLVGYGWRRGLRADFTVSYICFSATISLHAQTDIYRSIQILCIYSHTYILREGEERERELKKSSLNCNLNGKMGTISLDFCVSMLKQ